MCELEEAVSAYWDCAYQEGHLRRSDGTKAQEILSNIRATVRSLIAAEREACARVCDTDADKMELEAQRAIENGEHDEVSAIRSTAWKLRVAASRIRARSNDQHNRPASAGPG